MATARQDKHENAAQEGAAHTMLAGLQPVPFNGPDGQVMFIAPKVFSTGRQGYYGQGQMVIGGVVRRVQVTVF